MVFRTLNDPILYVALLPECWVNIPPRPPPPNRCWSGGHWLRKKQRVPPPARVRKHDWSHMPAFSTITTAGIYLVAPLLLSSYAASYLVRKCVIGLSRGSLWGEARRYCEDRNSLSHQSSFKIINNNRQIKTLQTQQYDAGLCALSFNVCYMFICRET